MFPPHKYNSSLTAERMDVETVLYLTISGLLVATAGNGSYYPWLSLFSFYSGILLAVLTLGK